MSITKKIILIIVTFVGVIILGFVGLVFWAIMTQPSPVTVNDPHIITVSQGTSAQYWGLHFGCASVDQGKYFDEMGIQREGRIAILKFHYPADTSKDIGVTVYAGKDFKVAGYSIKTEEINQDWPFGGSVRLRIMSPRDQRLADPGLLYASINSYSMCSNDQGQGGACTSETFLFSSGKMIGVSTFDRGGDNVSKTETTKDLGKATADKIAKQLIDSKVLTDDCSGMQVYDASWSYQVNLNGVMKEFDNPPQTCTAKFDKIDKLINQVAKVVKETPTAKAQMDNLVRQLEGFSAMTPDAVSKALGVALTSDESQSNEWYAQKNGIAGEGSKFGMILDSAELRMPKESGKGGLLILNIKDNLDILESDIMKEYPKAIPELAEATAPSSMPMYLKVNKSWGKMTFGISREKPNRVVNIIFDSIDE
ncbi:MAG: hypothetical protein WCW31_03130 [Patescibacteria group bacterium]